jgi:heme-degrading monooxygenase HmoA
MFARVSYFEEQIDDIDTAVSEVEKRISPQLESIPGFLGMQYLVDREEGRSIAVTFWEDQKSMHASEEDANRIRREASDLTESKTVKVERYEVAIQARP